MRPSHILLAIAAILIAAPSASALEPADVMVLYNTKSRDSLGIARVYMRERHIPEANLIPLICPVGEETTEDEYRKNIVPQVQKALASRPNAKCLVTTYDIPLKIGPYKPATAEQPEIKAYKSRLEEILLAMDSEIAAYNHVAGGDSDAKPAATQAATKPAPVKVDLEQFQSELQKINAAANAASQRIAKLNDAARGAAITEIAKVQERVAGIAGLLTAFQVKDDAPNADAVHANMEVLQTKLRDVENQITDLMKDKTNPDARKKIIDLRKISHGSIGEARQIFDVLNYLAPIESESCLDNELAMVLAEQDYPRGRWLINPKNIDLYPPNRHFEKVPKTILVTRLDGSTPAKTMDMIALTVKTEKAGLEGKMYLDARGLTEGPYSVLDIQLRQLAAWMKTNSTMDCILDDKPELLLAKNCPSAALYCGWYSVHNYQDSCQWLPGGVGYHVASFEMVSLHNPKENGWVVNLLNRGYCGTLGPTAEPYLASFPNPAHFFPLLLSGEFTQGEVWEVTAPMLSSRTGYVGDPLYNPFKAHPKVKIEVIKADPVLRNAFAILRPDHKPESAGAPAIPAATTTMTTTRSAATSPATAP